MSELIRLAAGQVSGATLLATDSYLVRNFPRQSDMTSSMNWSASQPNKMLQQEARFSLGGGANYYGGFSGELAFYYLTELQRQYLHNTIMGGKPEATVTVYMATVLNGFQAMVGLLSNPFAVNAESDYETMGYANTHSNIYLFKRGSIIETTPSLLLEDGGYLLLEDGGLILLEDS